MRQRHFEYFRHFLRIGSQGESRCDYGDNGNNVKSGKDQVRFEIADDTNVVARETDLFFRLSKCSSERSFVVLFEAAARKADLTCMVLEMRSSLREQHRESLGPIDQRHQHRGGTNTFRR